MSSDPEAVFAAAWRSRGGLDPATLMVPGARTFSVRREQNTLSVTSHVTGSTFEVDLPLSDDALREWLEERARDDVWLFEHEPT
jgi:hypothetical protein